MYPHLRIIAVFFVLFCCYFSSAKQVYNIWYWQREENINRFKKKGKKKKSSNLVYQATYRFNPTVFFILECGGKGRDRTFFTCLFSLDLFLSVPPLIFLKCAIFHGYNRTQKELQWGCGEGEGGNLAGFRFQLGSKPCFMSCLINQIGYMMTSIVWNSEKSGKMPKILYFSQCYLFIRSSYLQWCSSLVFCLLVF